MNPEEDMVGLDDASTVEEQASAWFLRQRQRPLDADEALRLRDWLEESPAHALAWEETRRTWQCFEDHATLPELVVAREQALASVRQTQVRRWVEPARWRARNPRRWFAAAAAVGVLALGVLWQTGQFGGQHFSTGIGEQRTVLLADNSNMVLDALTRVRVRFNDAERLIEMREGQAQFTVAADGNRPFRVRAGDRLIEALGTAFTVSYIDKEVHVALLEGRVRVGVGGGSPHIAAAAGQGQILHPGEALSIAPDGKQILDSGTDLAAATAWRQGKVIFMQEPLSEAVRRLNRYSRVQLVVADPDIAQWPVSGIFGAGDAAAFAEALADYFPIEAQQSGRESIELRRMK